MEQQKENSLFRQLIEKPKEKAYGVKFYNNPLSLTSQFYFCPVPLRLDTYSGCIHSCVYCFANSSNQKNCNVTDKTAKDMSKTIIPTKLEYVKKYFDIAFNGKKNTFDCQEALAIECLKRKVPIHFGGMSDPLQPLEEKIGVTYEVLKLLKSYNYPIILSTKGRLILSPKYIDLLKDYENFGLQISLIDDREEVIKSLEPNAMSVEERLKALKLYADLGKWTACRIQPLIINLTESRIIPLLDKLKAVNCKHVMVEGLKFYSGNKNANKNINNVFKEITGKEYDLEAYYKAIGSKNSGNDLELPSWRKYRYAKIFAEEIKKRGMTFGCADNDLRFLGDSPCCCGIEGLKGFENTLKHNTGYAIFRALKAGKKEFSREIIEEDYIPEGKFRQVISLANLKARLGPKATSEDANRPLIELFNKAWEKGDKNSPCDVCICRAKGCGRYGFISPEKQEALLKDRGEQKNLI